MTLFYRTACTAIMVVVIAMFASGCASSAPGTTVPIDEPRQAENQRKQADLKAMEESVVRDNDGTPVRAGTVQ